MCIALTEAKLDGFKKNLVPRRLLQEPGMLAKEISHPEIPGEIRMKCIFKEQCIQELRKILNKENYKELY